MTIEELQQALKEQDISKTISLLKGKRELPPVGDLQKQYNPSGHDVMDSTKRRDKQIKKDGPNGTTVDDTVKVNRIALPMQKRIVESAVSFLFGNPVQYNAQPVGDKQETLFTGLKKIFKDNKIDSFNRRIAREMFRSTEVAECWFPVKVEEHEDYGFKTTFKLRVTSFNPWDGNELYPLFDETGDMIAFSRAYSLKDDEGKEEKYFETYTAASKTIWKENGGKWEVIKTEENTIGKIPIVYGRQEQVEWADVKALIDRLEYLLSNFADTIDYNASPTWLVKGDVKGFAAKGESGKILELKGSEADAKILSWDQAPEAVKLEIETLMRMIYSFSQTPDLSFDSVKGLGDPSGETIRMMMMDPHLKVQTKQEVFDEYLLRRNNVVKAFIGQMKVELKPEINKLEIENEITPYIINEEKSIIDRFTNATGGKPILSRKTALKLSGLVENADQEYKQILAEEQEERKSSVTETAF